MPYKHELTSSTLRKLLTPCITVNLCCFPLSCTQMHTQNGLAALCLQGTCLFFKCRQLPVRSISVSKAMAPSYTSFCMSIWCLHIKFCGLSVCACCWWYCALHYRAADVTDMIILSKPGQFHSWLFVVVCFFLSMLPIRLQLRYFH